MITSYIVKQNDSLMCGNCRMRLPRLIFTCPFCGAMFSNYESVMHELYLDFENGKINAEQIEKLISGGDTYGEEAF